MRFLGYLLFFASSFSVCGQAFTSYFTGDTSDVLSSPVAGTVLMGGATENDNAMRWFLERANGGDILVLRASGEDGYNDYFYSELGITVNSVQTIVCNSAEASFDPYLITQIENAEALWFAGGDQWNYVSYWRDTPVEDAINLVINEKKIPVGGTSAGSAIMGEAYFSAENGTITSSQALNDPYSNFLTLGYADFINNPQTWNLITDTHYDNPDRRGRHIVFIARLFQDHGLPFYGIACEEYTAVCIDENNIAHAFGAFPEEEDYVYFLQVNCFEPASPEICTDGENLTWDRNDAALKVIKMGADQLGSGTLDLNDWKTVSGGDFIWENWWAEDGDLNVLTETTEIDCTVNNHNYISNQHAIIIYPNPAADFFILKNPQAAGILNFELSDLNGRMVLKGTSTEGQTTININSLPPSVYSIKIYNADFTVVKSVVIK